MIVTHFCNMPVIYYIDLSLCALINWKFNLMSLSQNCSMKSFQCNIFILPALYTYNTIIDWILLRSAAKTEDIVCF